MFSHTGKNLKVRTVLYFEGYLPSKVRAWVSGVCFQIWKHVHDIINMLTDA